MMMAVSSSEPSTIPATRRARRCEQTATPVRVCRPPLDSPPVQKKRGKVENVIKLRIKVIVGLCKYFIWMGCIAIATRVECNAAKTTQNWGQLCGK